MTDCPRCAILEERIRELEAENQALRAELDRRETVLRPPPPNEELDDIPSPVEYLRQCERLHADTIAECLPTDCQEGS